jgi:hypothetical protein
MSNFGYLHLQIGQMLNIDLIPDLRSKGVKGQFFRNTEIKDRALYLDLCTGRRSNCSTFDHQSLSVYLSIQWERMGEGGSCKFEPSDHGPRH